MKYLSIFVLLFHLISCQQKNNTFQSFLKPASEYFPDEKVQILVLGMFHLDYPGLDVQKTNEEDKIDVLIEPKKTEITEIIEHIKKFRPNKIAIEAFQNWGATDKLRGYNAGEHREKRDERYQIAIRTASELNLDTIYSINEQSYDNDLLELDTSYFKNLFEDFDFKSDDPYNAHYQNWFSQNSKIIPKVNLLDYLKLINSRESHQYGYGAYLVGDFKLDNTRGADILSIWWYNRNLRIFRKIQQMVDSTNDRILIIIGNGHAEILRQLLESSPEFEFVELDNLN